MTLWLRLHRGPSVAIGVLVFAAVSAWNTLTPSPDIELLLAAPVAIVALACGRRTGMLTAAGAALLGVLLGPSTGASDASHALIFLLIGGPMGFCSDRLADAQAALITSTQGEATLADLVPGQVWTARPDGSLDYVNARVCEFFGRGRYSVAHTGLDELMHPDDVRGVVRRWKHALASGEPYEATFRLRRHDGEYRSHIGRAMPQRDAGGQIVRWCGANIDLSEERAQHEELRASRDALEESEDRYRLLFEHSPYPNWLYDARTLSFTAANAAAVRAYGYSLAEFLSMTIRDIRPPEDLGRLETTLPVHGTRTPTEWRHMKKDGTVIDVEVISDDIPGTDPPQRLVLAHDITVRKRTEQALRDSEERYRQIVETASEGIWQVDVNHRTTFVNPKMAEMLGYEPAEMLGRPFEEFHAEEALYGRDPARPDPGSEPRVRRAFARKDGANVEALLSRRLLGDPAGSLGVLAMVSDVTAHVRADQERVQLQAQLVQSQKMESVGQLAGGIAHDFNNLLAVILNYAEFASDDPGGETFQDDLLQIRRAAERAAALTRKLLVFSRKGVNQPEVLDVNALVEDAHQLLERTLGEHIELATRYTADTPPIKADPTQIEQVLMNLAVNARDAMPGGGRLSLETAVHEIARGDWFGGDRPTPGTYARITVSDTGCGMSAETAAHAFEPFFTTKAKGEGTGLGLATIYGVVTQAGGHIELRSTPGRCTTVALILPATTAPVRDVEPSAPHPETQPATILLAEDEEEVRNLANRILTGQGYTVLAARDPYDAILTCDSHDGPIDLLLTDVVMPKMAGPELAERVTALRPDINVLFMSGYPNDATAPEALESLLSKPFSGADLTRAVSEALTYKRDSTAATICSTPAA
ncbi:MAG: PAS domain S-box protein [Solirubrobacteraceae bacterium]